MYITSSRAARNTRDPVYTERERLRHGNRPEQEPSQLTETFGRESQGAIRPRSPRAPKRLGSHDDDTRGLVLSFACWICIFI